MWRSWDTTSVTEIDARLYNFKILFAYNSGKIENESITFHDTREIFENGQALNYTGDPRALFELNNQKLCYEYLKQKIAGREPITTGFILETHAALTGGTYDERRYVERGERPGAFKRHDYMIGREETGAPPCEVPLKIEELLGEINAAVLDPGDILTAGAYFHLKFEHIHPFADGNGRVGRTLLNYFFMTVGHPPLIIYDEDKADYYAALEFYDKTEDIEPMRSFLRSQTIKTWRKTYERTITDDNHQGGY